MLNCSCKQPIKCQFLTLGVRPFCFLHWNMARLVWYILLLVYTEIWLCEYCTSHWFTLKSGCVNVVHPIGLHWNLAVWMLHIPLITLKSGCVNVVHPIGLHWNLAVWMLDIPLVYTEIWLCECCTSYWFTLKSGCVNVGHPIGLHWNLAVWMLDILLFTLKSNCVNATHNTALHWLNQVLTGYIIGAAMILRLVF